MNTEETKKRLREIVNKSARTLTEDDRSFVLYVANELGIERVGKSGCVKCWHDLAVRCYSKIAENEQPENDDTRKYILKKGVDVYFGNIRVNEATLTDELAERILARGFERKFFAKCE